MRFVLVLALGICTTLGHRPAYAQDVRTCARVSEELLAETGATSMSEGEGEVRFLMHGESAVLRFTLDRPGCAAVVAQVAPQLTRLDLRLVTAQGMVVSNTIASAPLGYARFCGAAGLTLTAVARAMAGQGEISLQAYVDAPSELPTHSASSCLPMPRGIDASSLPVGPAPRGMSALERAESASAAAASLGYEELWSRSVDASEGTDLPLHFDGAHCYALHLAAGRVVPILELRIEGGEEAVGRAHVARTRSATELWLSFCPLSSRHGTVTATLGGERLTLFRLSHAEEAVPDALAGDARMAFDELALVWRARNLRPRLHTAATSGPGETLRLPMSIPRAGCYGFALVPTGETVGQVLRLTLLDANDNVIARGLARRDAPILYHCSRGEESVSLLARSERGEGTYLVFQGDPRTHGDDE